ncbi:MAG: helix-turn-helix transcriptional regulator [Gammaproteobacteria bacterium]|nr:helix-turn-helix transcriptional regulator [Gammaproteobacteria bacterium]NHN36848.1 helix-turn-helix transcriptional regulator [Pseudomaricurvus alcaniphilus]
MLRDLTLKQFSLLLAYLYDGHLQEDPYSKFLELLRGLMDLNFASITLREPLGEDGGVLFVSCDSLKNTYVDDHEIPYTDRYYASSLMTDLPWGEVVTMDEIMPSTSFEKSDLYKICMEPINIYHMAGMDLCYLGCKRFAVRLCRPKDAPNFSAEEKHFLHLLGGHIQRAVANGMQLIKLDNECRFFCSTITSLSIGTISLNERAEVLGCNSAAESLLAEKDGITVVNNQIHLTNTGAREKLHAYITESLWAQRNRSAAPVYVMAVPRPSSKSNLEILIKPLAIDNSVAPGDTPRLVVFVSDPEKQYEINVNVLTSLYQLTRAEAVLAKYLSAGITVDECATSLGITRNTVRAQLRSIFAKTGVTKQSVLVSLVLRSLARLS